MTHGLATHLRTPDLPQKRFTTQRSPSLQAPNTGTHTTKHIIDSQQAAQVVKGLTQRPDGSDLPPKQRFGAVRHSPVAAAHARRRGSSPAVSRFTQQAKRTSVEKLPRGSLYLWFPVCIETLRQRWPIQSHWVLEACMQFSWKETTFPVKERQS